MISGQGKLGETEKQVLTEKGVVFRFLKLKAGASNTGGLFVGKKGVTKETGFELAKGQSETFQISDPATLYVIGTENDTFSYIGY